MARKVNIMNDFDVRSVSTDAVASVIVDLLAKEPGRVSIRYDAGPWDHRTQTRGPDVERRVVHSGWISGSGLTNLVTRELGLDIPWPGNERFHAKVQRVANALVDEGKIHKVGKGERHPMPNGSEAYAARNEPQFISIAGFGQVQAQFVAAREAQQRQARTNDEREQKLNGWIMEQRLADEPVLKLSHYTDGDEVTLPADVVEELLIRLAQLPV